MKRIRIALSFLILLIIGLSWWLFTRGPGGTQPNEEKPQAESTMESPVVRVESSGIDEARQRVADAELALQTVIAQRKSAEMELEQSERDVEELERFIEDIEARGEDPVDYADEGLAKFQPAFNAYQDAFDRLELAETMEQAAVKELAEAEDQLARVLAR